MTTDSAARFEMNQLEQTMVVVPSISLDLDAPGAVLQAYGERFLILLLLLRKPGRAARASSAASFPRTRRMRRPSRGKPRRSGAVSPEKG